MTKQFIKPKHFWKFSKNNISHKDHLALDWLNSPAVFETMRVYHARVFALDEHMQRLFASAKDYCIHIPWTLPALKAWLADCQQVIKSDDIMLRLSIQKHPTEGVAALLLIRPISAKVGALRKKGLKLKTSSVRLNSITSSMFQAKGNNYLNSIQAWVQDQPKGLGQHVDSLHLTTDGYVGEGGVSNVFAIKKSQIWTPPAACGILLGITRQTTLQMAQNIGLKCHQSPLTRHDLYTADELLITNTSLEIMPVIELDARQIG
ncbi:MAG: branched-chain amino acid aminotransferase, partial [Candidatus Omnitrophota bacterium]